eukprot:2935636-Alexandrium_andersonii.AAC.1
MAAPPLRRAGWLAGRARSFGPSNVGPGAKSGRPAGKWEIAWARLGLNLPRPASPSSCFSLRRLPAALQSLPEIAPTLSLTWPAP